MKYRLDPETKRELANLRAEAIRLGTDPDTFISQWLGLTLAEYQVFLATGEKPVGHSDE